MKELVWSCEVSNTHFNPPDYFFRGEGQMPDQLISCSPAPSPLPPPPVIQSYFSLTNVKREKELPLLCLREFAVVDCMVAREECHLYYMKYQNMLRDVWNRENCHPLTLISTQPIRRAHSHFSLAGPFKVSCDTFPQR